MKRAYYSLAHRFHPDPTREEDTAVAEAMMAELGKVGQYQRLSYSKKGGR